MIGGEGQLPLAASNLEDLSAFILKRPKRISL